MRIAAVADLHVRATENTSIEEMLAQIKRDTVDVLIVAGDITDNGLLEEAEIAVKMLRTLKKPVIAVLGNHDHEGGNSKEIFQLLHDQGIHMLDGNTMMIDDVGFVGTKGFCGGFGKRMVQPYGEDLLKEFINASIEESLRLENSLAKLDCENRVVVLHYAPIAETLEGEPPELFPLLGTSRFAEVVDRHGASFIVHGHAHYGTPSGTTAGKVPVYNVSRFVLQRHTNKSYCIFDLPDNSNRDDSRH